MQIPDCKCRGWGWWRPRLLCWTTHQSTVWTIQVTAGQVFFLDFLLKWGNLSGSCWNYSSILWVILDLTEILSKGGISTFGISKKKEKGLGGEGVLLCYSSALLPKKVCAIAPSVAPCICRSLWLLPSEKHCSNPVTHFNQTQQTREWLDNFQLLQPL